MSNEKHDWELVTKIADKSQPDQKKPSVALKTHHTITSHEGVPARPDSAIANFKANKEKRKAAIEATRIWYKGQLDVMQHAVSESVRVRKAEASKAAEQMLMGLDAEHLKYLVTLGLKNFDFRNQAMKQLGDQTAQSLKEIEDRDWPPKLIEKTVAAIFDQHEKFFEQILKELGSDE